VHILLISKNEIISTKKIFFTLYLTRMLNVTKFWLASIRL